MSTNTKRNRRRRLKAPADASRLPVRSGREPEDPRPSDPWESPCPDGNLQVPRRCTGYMEREPGRLQLRVDLCSTPYGIESVCDVLVVEEQHDVFVKVLVCCPPANEPAKWDGRLEAMNCPCHVYLDAPLNGRAVRDMLASGAEVPYRNVWDEIKQREAERPQAEGWQAEGWQADEEMAESLPDAWPAEGGSGPIPF